MKGIWWKALGVIILLYTFTVGMLVPLKPGIAKISPDSAKGGDKLVITANCYNTRLEDNASDLRAWLKLDEEHILTAEAIVVESQNRARLTFQIPESLPEKPQEYALSLIIDDPKDGAYVLPSAVFVSPSSIAISPDDTAGWKGSIDDLNEVDHLTFPFRNILEETIRNTYFHVPLWFGMIIILLVSVIYSIRYLSKFNPEYDRAAVAFTTAGTLFGVLGLITGAIWAQYTWGKFWSWDIKQIVTAITLLIYLAYFVLRSSFDDLEQRARIAAVYNVFAFAAMIPLLFIIPRLKSVGVSLHPGNAGNPGFGGEDLDNTMRLIFYPSIIGWTLIGVWVATLIWRYSRVRDLLYERMN